MPKLRITYADRIHPMPNIDPNNKDGYPDIESPSLRRQPRRPRKARKKSVVEGPLGNQQSKRSNILRCSNCNLFGHNSRTCQRAPMKNKKKVSMM